MTVAALPRRQPGSAESGPRWIPARAGILNVWRYYDEIFEFHDGRLLLRGPNGSGKSKALELLLPFLFDASLRANRLSTFGTGERTMHWNLMEGATGVTRVGYVWLEFRRAGDPERWFTCGARLQATSRTTTVHPDYFTTGLRIGSAQTALSLTDAGRPLSRTALEERLGDAGRVYPSAADYRDAVRTNLFPDLSEQQYDALITALLQLRTPKLSQRLDPALLSTLLSRALPPLSHAEIADLAEGFERLDAQRERLARLDAEVAATRTLARHQRTYAQRVLRAGAAGLISATTDLDRLAAVARTTAEQYTQTEQRRDETQARIAVERTELTQAQARREGLMKSEAYKQGLQLDELRGQAGAARARAAALTADAQRLQGIAADDARTHTAAIESEQSYAQTAEQRADDTRQAAHRAGLLGIYDELAADPEADASRALLRGAVRAAQDRMREMTDAIERYDRAVEARTGTEEDLEDARTGYTRADDAHTRATADHDRELTDLRDRLRDWAAGCRALSFGDPGALGDLAADHRALTDAVAVAVHRASEAVLRRKIQCDNDIQTSIQAIDERVDERDSLIAEHDIEPGAPRWRDTDRTALPGAPLWRLVDFADDIPESTAARVEAALESAGLLDAWLEPHGELRVGNPGSQDIFADPGALPVVSGRSLADVLIPVRDALVDPDRVRRLLAAVAFDDHLPSGPVAAVAADGGWRLGNLTGTRHKDQPAFIGAVTRERARQRRIRQLDGEIADCDAALARLRARQRQLSAEAELIETERTARPSHDALDVAENRLIRTESELSAADGAVRRQVGKLSARQTTVRQALHALSALAADTGLPTERTGLASLAAAVEDFAGHATGWLDAQRAVSTARATTSQRSEQAKRSAAEAESRAESAATATDEQLRLHTELAAVAEAVGRDYHDVLTEIGELRIRIDTLGEHIDERRDRLTGLAADLGRLAAERDSAVTARDTATAERDRLARQFRYRAGGTFPEDAAVPELPAFRDTLAASDGVRAALDAARLVAATWPSVPHAPANLNEAVRRLSEAVHDCRTALNARADLDLETDDDTQVLTAVVDGVRVGCAELLHILDTEAQQSKSEITEHERRLFDQTLTGDTRRHLAARIRQANELVDGMNARLERVRTASKVAVQLVWQVGRELPPGTKAARDLLLKDPVRLTDADRESLHRFLRDRIEEAKAADTATSWEQQLTEVFDYTAWHRFVVRIDRGTGDGYQELTKKLHGALSGGEKAIALHLPLFAAVAAHYQATPQAPRVILLDEVFVGVDTVNRGQIFALLTALDLDLILTSDHEWCTYAELGGIAIHQIVGGDGEDAVTTARFTWDGHALAPA